MRKLAVTSMLIATGLSLGGCSSTDRALKQVSSAELPKIPRLERSLPVHVDVEGSRGRRIVVLAVPPPAPQLTQREKEILGEPEDDQGDLFEFYVPYAGRNRMVGSYSGEVTVGKDGPVSIGAAGGYKKSFWRVAASEGGVLVGHGPALRVAHKGGPSTPVTAIGGIGEVTVGYDRASRVARRETRRFYRP